MVKKRRRVVLRHPVTGMAEIHVTRLSDKRLDEWTHVRRLGRTSHPDRAPDTFEGGFVWRFASGEARPIAPEGVRFARGRRFRLPDGRAVDLLAFVGVPVGLLVERWRSRGGRVRDEEVSVFDAAGAFADREEIFRLLKFIDAGTVRPEKTDEMPENNVA